jgi:hypothetical protein
MVGTKRREGILGDKGEWKNWVNDCESEGVSHGMGLMMVSWFFNGLSTCFLGSFLGFRDFFKKIKKLFKNRKKNLKKME